MVKQNKHGELNPINYDHCPYYKKIGEKRVCYDGNGIESCIGIRDGSFIKQVKDFYLLECSYMVYFPTQKEKGDGM